MILLKNALVVSPKNNLNSKKDILIAGEQIVDISDQITSKDAEVYDLKGMIVIPGLIDMHVHLREPGFEEKETIKSGIRAAVSGGFTQIAAMPNTNPVADDASVIKHVKEVGQKQGLTEVHPLGAATIKQQGEHITQMGDMIKAGAITFSDDGQPIMDSYIMRRVLEYASLFNKRVVVHAEDRTLSRKGVMNEGYVATKIGLPGVPNAAEEVMIARDITLARYFGKVHFAHVSTAFGLELIKMAKQLNIDVTCEVTPHHLLYTESMLEEYDTNAKVSPPLRTEDDRLALINGLRDGTVDIIATDHAPHTRDDKQLEFNYAANGISGLETALPMIYSGLVVPGKISLEKMVELMSSNPAKIFDLDGGIIVKGGRADLTVIDPLTEKKVDTCTFKSKGKNTPLEGKILTGWCLMTMVKGKIGYYNGEIMIRKGK